jgi:hypothetical protein
MSAATRPAVEAAMPPRLVLQVINPAIRAVLRSPLHRLLSRRLMVLTVTGRTTGRTYSIPVGRHEADGLLIVSASGAWRHNLRGGAPVRVTIEGRDRFAHADLEEDPFEVAQTFKTLLDRVGGQASDGARAASQHIDRAHRGRSQIRGRRPRCRPHPLGRHRQQLTVAHRRCRPQREPLELPVRWRSWAELRGNPANIERPACAELGRSRV